jgi:hypothetical protein
MTKVCTLVFGVLLFINNRTVADQFDHLTPRFSGTSAGLNAIAYGAGTYVAIGDGGVILKSLDSVFWSQQSSSLTNELRGVTFAKGLFVAVGKSGTILTSPDGNSWIVQNSGVTNRLNSVVSSGSAFVAVGDSGTILYSTNGGNWQSIATGVPYNLNGVTFGIANYVGSFVIVGDTGVLLTSPDGLAWTVRSSGTFLNLNAVAGDLGNFTGGDGVASFIAVGQSGVIDTSSDGVTWTVRNSGVAFNLHSVAFEWVGHWGVTGDGGTFLTSYDLTGATWTSRASETTNSLQGITFANGGYVAVGGDGTIQATFLWVQRASGVSSDLSNVVWAANDFVAVGTLGTILSSSNGVNWTQCDSGTTNNLSSVTYDGNRFIAVGGHTVDISTDGIAWTPFTVFPPDSSTNFFRVAYGNGVYVAMARFLEISNLIGTNLVPSHQSIDGVFISTDAVDWTPPGLSFQIADNSIAPGLTFGGGLFVVTGIGSVGTGGTYTSSDGLNWYQVSQGGYGTVSYVNGLFVAQAGPDLAISTNATNWTEIGLSVGNYWTGPSFGDGVFLLASEVDYVTSPDGVNWTERGNQSATETQPLLLSVAFHGGTFVAVGAGGLIFQSVSVPSTVSASLVPQGINLKITGDIGRNFVLEAAASPTTASWTTLFSVTNAPYATNFIDAVTNAPQRFYRAREW